MFALLFGSVKSGGLGFLFVFRCSDNAIAIACLTLVTTGPCWELLCSLPFLYSRITFLILLFFIIGISQSFLLWFLVV